MSGTHAERPVSGLFLTELEKLDLYTLNASRTERFFACFWWFSGILYEVPAACAAAVITKREVLTLDSSFPPAPPPPLTPPSPPPPPPPKGERGERTGEERKNFPPFSVRLLHFFACVLYSHPAPVCVEPLGHG